MNTEVLFSSECMTWETPQLFFNQINEEFNFTLDVCAFNENKKCDRFISPQENALTRNWDNGDNKEICWMNPPYGRGIGVWIKKAYEQAERGNTIVALIPSRTDTKWFHEYIYNKHEIRFIKGRLKFGDSVNAAPFPSMLIIFKPTNNQ